MLPQDNKGFTLIELLVCVALLAILALGTSQLYFSAVRGDTANQKVLANASLVAGFYRILAKDVSRSSKVEVVTTTPPGISFRVTQPDPTGTASTEIVTTTMCAPPVRAAEDWEPSEVAAVMAQIKTHCPNVDCPTAGELPYVLRDANNIEFPARSSNIATDPVAAAVCVSNTPLGNNLELITIRMVVVGADPDGTPTFHVRQLQVNSRQVYFDPAKVSPLRME